MMKLNQIVAAALVSLSVNAFAGDCPEMEGKYTIGKHDGADFRTINDAVAALECGGVSGPVTFSIEKGMYNERVTMHKIEGASVMNPVTFTSSTGSNGDVVIWASTSDATMVLNGTSYVSFENITVDHKGAVYGNSMRVNGASENVHFKSVVFEGVEVARTGTANATVYFTPTAEKANIAFQDCEINNGSTGIYKTGVSNNNLDSKTSITGTLFFNQFESALVLANENAPNVSNNVVSSLSNYASFKGISLSNVTNAFTVNSNVITLSNGSTGIEMNNCMSPATAYGKVNSNSISVGGVTATGIVCTGNTNNQVINFNRIKITGSNKLAPTQAYYRNMGTGSNINIVNNIMYDMASSKFTILGNKYSDTFNQLPGSTNNDLSASANGLTIETVSPIK